MIKVAVIGGGAAGFFAAIAVKENFPDSQVIIFEKTKKILTKVKISGGGRCNVTNGSNVSKDWSEAYPRGKNFIKKAFKVFNYKDTIEWFSNKGIDLKIEADNRMFPSTNDSETIINCLVNEANRLKIKIAISQNVVAISPKDNCFDLSFSDNTSLQVDKVIVASGGSPKSDGLNWLKELGHDIEEPVPSLFTFNMPSEPITLLQGVAQNVLSNIQGSNIRSQGPLLITHWGMSGPAILKLSSFGARELHKKKYQFNLVVNWVNEKNEEVVQKVIVKKGAENPNKLIRSVKPFPLPSRLWDYLLNKSGVSTDKKWNEFSKKGINKLTNILCADIYSVSGKTTFKEEFVTCGGISLQNINSKTMESKVCKGLYFAGEVMDIDGITGGFNFQAAWTTGFIAGKLA